MSPKANHKTSDKTNHKTNYKTNHKTSLKPGHKTSDKTRGKTSGKMSGKMSRKISQQKDYLHVANVIYKAIEEVQGPVRYDIEVAHKKIKQQGRGLGLC
ncbi:hypothetical protein EDB81DRAFT_823925 [Dactylonectria macrodidyma]|uniref:Uncharacterized protein n=1 Tax=Dactylonectria macrodidyma TaxID=307937 RepID=A0A9P9D7A7_9HYPO|nr:hypothetical protein EDB81DRAFT_823925 [Dactylonectria macrodidyma]